MLKRFFILLYMMRIPVIALLLLGAGLPLAFRTSMLHGFADLAMNQVAFVSLVAFLLLCTAMTCMFLVLLYGIERTEGQRTAAPNPPRQVSPWIVALLYIGSCFCYGFFLEEVHRFMVQGNPGVANLTRAFITQAAIGFALGCVFMLLLFAAVLRIAKPEDDSSLEVFAIPAFLLLQNIGWVRQGIRKLKNRPAAEADLGTGYASHRGRGSLFLVRILGPGFGSFDNGGAPTEIHPGLRFAMILMTATLFIYWWAGRGVYHRLVHPDMLAVPRLYDCVLTYFLLLVIVLCWLLTGMTFFFDRYRVPVLAALAAILYVLSFTGASDHSFDTVPSPTNAAISLPSPPESLERAPDSVILVAAAGGGIQSAAWTSQVLCGLRQQIGPEFEHSLVAISGVSGGSVGTMFYLRCLEEGANDAAPAEWARKSSLEAVAWGLTHPDVRRALLPVSWSWRLHTDRGWALQQALLNHAQFKRQNQLLGDPSTHGNWPILLLNSTESETGDPMVFTNSNFPPQGAGAMAYHALRNFHRLHPGRDVNLETAVRMSAAFPYVSPVATAYQAAEPEHLADGGYFDNSGLYTLAQWLKLAAPTPDPTVTSRSPRPPAKKRFLILQLDAFPDWGTDGVNRPRQKWFYQVWAPLTTILSVRSEGAVIRDDSEGRDLLEILAWRGYETTQITLRYEPDEDEGCPADPPLSWHLTPLEQSCIVSSWDEVCDELSEQVRIFLHPQNVPAPAAKKLAPPGPLHVEETIWEPALGFYVRKTSR